MSIISSIKASLRPLIHDFRRARRAKALAAARPAVSAARLVDDLAQLPVPPGAVVLVHSSLKALGYVEGGAPAVVEALVEVFAGRNGGTVMLPAYSIDGSMHRTLASGRLFDVAATPSNLGAIPEAFRRHPGAVRSVHPTHSFTAVGRDAAWLVEEHHRCGSSFGPGSPMARMLERESWLLGLGTDLGKVTFYHCLEDTEADFPLDVYTADSPVTAACRDLEGRVHHLALRAHDGMVSRTRIDRPESQALRRCFTAWLERQAGMDWHRVGEAKSWLIEADALYREACHLMRQGLTVYSSAAEVAAFEARAGTSAARQPAGGTTA